MSAPVVDILIWILLAAGTGFFALGFFGLLIFPDIRGRLFTASRATLIGAGLVILSVVLFGLSKYSGGGGNQYATLLIHTIFLFGILIIAYLCISRIIRKQIADVTVCPDTAGEPAASPANQE